MDMFLAYFGAVSICCGCYFVIRLTLIMVLLLFLPLFKTCPPMCKKIYLQWCPPILTLTVALALIILGIQFYGIISGDDRFYDVKAFVCYFLIVLFTSGEEVVFQLALLYLPILKTIQKTRTVDGGSIQYDNLYQSRRMAHEVYNGD